MCSLPLQPAHHQVGQSYRLAFKQEDPELDYSFFALSCSDSSSGSDDETAVSRQSSVVAPPPLVNPNLQSPDSWINRTVQGSSTSSSASSTLSHGEAKPQLQSQPQHQPQPQPQPQPQYKPQYQPLYQPHYQPQYQPQYQQQEQPHTAAVTNMLAQSRIGEALLLLGLLGLSKMDELLQEYQHMLM